jgi:hypothetical protein
LRQSLDLGAAGRLWVYRFVRVRLAGERVGTRALTTGRNPAHFQPAYRLRWAVGSSFEESHYMCDEILLRLGPLTAEQLATARTACSRESRPLTECLVRAGVIDERVLVATLASALRLPTVTAEQLAKVDVGVAALLPRELAFELRALPIAVDDEAVTIAFADAVDEHAVSEATFFVGRAVARAVAPPLALGATLERRFGIRMLSEPRSTASQGSIDSPESLLVPTNRETASGGQ